MKLPLLLHDQHVYMLCSLQFSEWLRIERRQFFNELSSEETHALFSEFAAAWNARKLPARYYVGITDASLRRTKHSWAIRGIDMGAGHAVKRARWSHGMLSRCEMRSRCHCSGCFTCSRAVPFPASWHACSGGVEEAQRGELGMAAALEDDQSAFGAAREADKASRKEWRAQQQEALDEMLPKATGRHACSGV